MQLQHKTQYPPVVHISVHVHPTSLTYAAHAHDAADDDDDSLAPPLDHHTTTSVPDTDCTRPKQMARQVAASVCTVSSPSILILTGAHGAATLIIIHPARLLPHPHHVVQVGPLGKGGARACVMQHLSELDALPIYEPRFLASSPMYTLSLYALPPPPPVQTESPAPWPAHALTCIQPGCTLPRPPTASASKWESSFATLLPTRNLLLHSPTLPIPVQNIHLHRPLGHPLSTSAPSRAQPLGYNP
ncbi:hypothetical protein COCMIDRAFT_34223 [Bipolaris oryzae ATCC 44560]|uniref:Uncharacterized protein n=1 Tax=Bipolaris oryzae ATCC 44560 TaxID=930090 RepID=W6ZLE1_COCMI|nr:uncharacterized protein COCMIDRAFT_34223 [Bipolaris oryzae ATCC 44560]EUC48349.1 hypothetical protein COCMIDRAFT_34223 [Bipolaris oryzae ATCC 44560]